MESDGNWYLMEYNPQSKDSSLIRVNSFFSQGKLHFLTEIMRSQYPQKSYTVKKERVLICPLIWLLKHAYIGISLVWT